MPRKKKEFKKIFFFDQSYKGKEGVLLLGLDISLTHSGVVLVDQDGRLVHREIIKMKDRVKDKKKHYRIEIIKDGEDIIKTIDITTHNHTRHEIKRMAEIAGRIKHLLETYPVTHVAMEGYALGVKGGGRVFDIGELGGAVKQVLMEKGFDPFAEKPTCFIVPPKSLKSYITGNGNAKKDDMMGAILRRYGIAFEDDNEGDAYALCMLLLDLGDEVLKFCQKHGPKIYKEQLENG